MRPWPASLTKRNRKRTRAGGRSTTPAKRALPARNDRPAVVDGIPAVRALDSVTVETTSVHYGPLPPADMLAEYDRVVPGLAERIIRMAERPLEMGEAQMHHRQQLENKVIRSDILRSWAGLVVATFLSLIVLGGGIFLAYKGKELAGLGSVLVGVAGLAAVFYKAKGARDANIQQDPEDTKRRGR